jgi:hypothetical protein
VQVDEARADHQPGHVDPLGALQRLDGGRRDHVAGHGHVGHRVQPAVRVDDPPARQYKGVHPPPALPSSSVPSPAPPPLPVILARCGPSGTSSCGQPARSTSFHEPITRAR